MTPADPTPAGTGSGGRERLAAALKHAWVAFPDQQDEGEPDVWVFMADAALRAAPVAADARPEAGTPSERERAHRLAMLALQSKRYQTDMDYRDAVDDVLAWTMPLTPPPPGGSNDE